MLIGTILTSLLLGCAPRVPPAAVVPEPITAEPLPTRIAVDTGAGIACWEGGRAVDCTDRCEGGCAVPVRIVGVAPIGGGAIELPVGRGTVDVFDNVTCTDWTVSEDEALEPASLGEGREPAIAHDLVADAIGEEADLDTWTRMPLGDADDVVVFEASTATGSVIGVVRGDDVTIVADDRQDPLPDDASEEERFDAELSRVTTTLRGVTDLDLDGRLDLVLDVAGYEAHGHAVLTLRGGRITQLASGGCAI